MSSKIIIGHEPSRPNCPVTWDSYSLFLREEGLFRPECNRILRQVVAAGQTLIEIGFNQTDINLNGDDLLYDAVHQAEVLEKVIDGRRTLLRKQYADKPFEEIDAGSRPPEILVHVRSFDLMSLHNVFMRDNIRRASGYRTAAHSIIEYKQLVARLIRESEGIGVRFLVSYERDVDWDEFGWTPLIRQSSHMLTSLRSPKGLFGDRNLDEALILQKAFPQPVTSHGLYESSRDFPLVELEFPDD